MSVLLSALGFALSVTLPNILLLVLGKILYLKKMITHDFCHCAAELVFKCALPLLLFINLVSMKMDYMAQAKLVAAGAISTVGLYVLAEIYAYFRIPEMRDKGVFVQGVFRSNLGIAGLAFVQNAYGAEGVATAAVYLGLITILLNILSVMALSRTQNQSLPEKIKSILGKIISNPLIVAIVIALTLNMLHFRLPEFVLQTFRYLAHIALPLALICAGATFDWQSIRKMSDVSLQASVGRLVLAPVFAVLVGYAFGFRGLEMGILFLMTATPVAAASYIMAKAMGGNDVAAANIMGITTFGAMFSASIGVAVLRGVGLM
ncbi:AEC family transporter [Alysiella filiformis]|uniref:Uncharacterized protein n=1 Tax=Alysiella filiformis DSM 16848 TaxID=1120981 RepID=A0A286EE88_9NEIS|nr:AEC family transporter [Alysiella filiformis]QMT30959.1 AEC family transporter [Alysiella filiformis]UBQ56054.1 AEC family transporter [Alysiella filiformis DSM 16848]SOD69220.1 hypothetical protein SAMN02746062_01576 [Alysiella filiformis DSM 16848]